MRQLLWKNNLLVYDVDIGEPMTDEEYMQLAIKKAHESEANGGVPIGAIIVKDGEVIAQGTSAVWPEKDPTAHGETTVMKLACKKLESVDLSGCTVYSTLESCSMCLGCAGWSGLSRIVFGAYQEDAPGNPYELSEYHAVEHAKRIKGLEVVGGVLRDECALLMKGYTNWIKENA